MRVLVTGAAGSIGSVVCGGLVDRGHAVTGLDLVPEPEGFTGPWFTGDCADADAVEAVFAALAKGGGLDAVVHLAGMPTEASLQEELASHVLTTAALLDAMVRHGVSRIVYASSNHAVGRTPRSDLLGLDARPRPDTFYGVAKVAAEGLLSLYVDRYGIDAVATRIGSFLPQPETVRGLSTWLSHDDAVRMFDACLTAPDPAFAWSTASRPTPVAGGTSPPGARSATTHRTTPSGSPMTSGPRPMTRRRRRTSAAPMPRTRRGRVLTT